MEYFYMFRRLWQFADRERWKVIVYLVLHGLSNVGKLAQPLVFGLVIDVVQRNSSRMTTEAVHWLLIYLLSYVVFEVFHRSARPIERYVAFRNRQRFTTAMYDRLQSLPLGWHADNHSGAIIDRVNKAAQGLHSFSESQFLFVQYFMSFVGSLIMLWIISPAIALVALCAGVLLVYVTKKLYNLSVPAYRSQNEGFHKVSAGLFDYISNIRTIITLRLGHLARQDIERRINLVFPFLKKENLYTQIKVAFSAAVMVGLDVGLIVYYIHVQHRSGHAVMAGSIAAIFLYLNMCMSSFRFYTGGFESVIHWKTDFEAVKLILDAKPNVPNSDGDALIGWTKLELRNVNFSYGPNNHQLTDVSVQLRPGRRIAFVGESGAGKSTALQLLRALIVPQEGDLIKDDIENLPFGLLGTTTTLIPQEPEIFENTIRYNITMGVPATEDEIHLAMWTAAFSDVVKKLPSGLDTDMREKGVNFSGGQSQRLALARGIFSIRDSSIVLLDEPTSNVDPSTEMVIFERLFGRLSEKCIVCALHRLHLLKLFDYIYVFKEGQIVEEGSLDELLTLRGEFTRLWGQYGLDDRNRHGESDGSHGRFSAVE